MVTDNHIPVYYEKFVVGHIILHDPQRLGFTYDSRWLATKGRFPLSVTLPLQPEEYINGVIMPWLANLLPEAQQLLVLSRALGLSTSDELAILLEIGGDTAGAISIGEASDRATWAYTPLNEQYNAGSERDALKAHFDDLGQRPFLVGEDGVRLSLAGGQKKTALAVLDTNGHPKLGLPSPEDRLAVPKNGAPSTIIIKPDNPALPGIVENEAYCLSLAGLIGIETVECEVVTSTDHIAIAVARYDRKLRRDGSIRRLHQEDFSQANSIYPRQKYEQGTVPGLSLNDLLKTANYLPSGEALKLLDQVIFNILVANTDAHAKNYSMILSGNPSMAPLYDVSSVLYWNHVNQYHAQKIASRKRKPGDTARRHWDVIAEAAGLNARGVRLRVQELVDAMVANRGAATDAVSNQRGVSAKMVNHVAELVEQNALRIAGRLNEVRQKQSNNV